MTRHTDERLTRLSRLAGLVHQARLDRLSEARSRIEVLRNHIGALEPADPDPADPAILQAQLRHRQWVTAARKKLEADLAKREARLDQLRRETAKSFARCRVVESLRSRTPPDQPS